MDTVEATDAYENDDGNYSTGDSDAPYTSEKEDAEAGEEERAIDDGGRSSTDDPNVAYSVEDHQEGGED